MHQFMVAQAVESALGDVAVATVAANGRPRAEGIGELKNMLDRWEEQVRIDTCLTTSECRRRHLGN